MGAAFVVREGARFEVLEFLRCQASKGGKAAAESMTPKQRKERPKVAAAASAKVRSQRGRARKKKAEKNARKSAR